MKTAERKTKASKAKSAKPSSKVKLGKVFGCSVVSVIRAMGKAGWDFETAQAALQKSGIKAATHTIKIGLKRGRDGQKKIAELSSQQLESLRVSKEKNQKQAVKSSDKQKDKK